MLRAIPIATALTAIILGLSVPTTGHAQARCDTHGNCTGMSVDNPNAKDQTKRLKTKPTPKAPPKAPPLKLIGPHCQADDDICNAKIPQRHRPSTPASPNPRDSIRQVVARLRLPDPTPRFGPDPSVNEWNMAAVGFPIWLWTDRPTSLSTTAHHDGLTFTLNATWQSTTFTLGDGHHLTCTDNTEYPTHVSHPGQPSPTCGYTYKEASPPGHPYAVTADAHWRVDWAAAGEHGTLTTSYSADRLLEVGELQSLVRG